MNNFYVYIYLDPRKPGHYEYSDYCFLYEPFYVGKGVYNRHLSLIGRNKYFMDIINSTNELKIISKITKIKENLTETESLKLEKHFIKLIGRKQLNNGPLINMSNGGETGYGKKTDFTIISDSFKRIGYTLLSGKCDYIDSGTKLKFVCNKNHINYIRWNDFKNGSKCSTCFVESEKNDFNKIKKEFKNMRYELLTNENEYKNNKTKLKYMCKKCKNEGSIRYNDFQQGHGCLFCNKAKLSINQIKKIKLLLIENKLSQEKIGKLFNVSQTLISQIKLGKIWKKI